MEFCEPADVAKSDLIHLLEPAGAACGWVPGSLANSIAGRSIVGLTIEGLSKHRVGASVGSLAASVRSSNCAVTPAAGPPVTVRAHSICRWL